MKRSLATRALAALLVAAGLYAPLGAVAGAWGVNAVYLAGAVAVGLSLLVAVGLLAAPQPGGRHA